MTAATFTRTGSDKSRWLLLGSLALNLFFVGVAVAMFVRQPSPPDRSVSGRIERLATALPAADGAILRKHYQANRPAVDGSRAAFETSRDAIRETVRREPFDAEAMRAAMTATRDARQRFDQSLQGVIVSAASEMSPAGRKALADFPPRGR